jgi:hypothetical protein
MSDYPTPIRGYGKPAEPPFPTVISVIAVRDLAVFSRALSTDRTDSTHIPHLSTDRQLFDNAWTRS